MSKAEVVLGAQWGDEGKGKLVDILSQTSDFCCRCQGGDNAGHTVIVDSIKYAFHLLPSGVLSGCMAVIGIGCVLHLPSFFQEIDVLKAQVFDYNRIADKLQEQELKGASLGTTHKGIGPTYASKASRTSLRMHHLFNFATFTTAFKLQLENTRKRFGYFDYDVEAELEMYKRLGERVLGLIGDTTSYVNTMLDTNKSVLVEGANALMLDIDHGTYPYVTSSSASVGGVCTGLGIPTWKLNKPIGVVKAYTTRVGAGPFPTEQLNAWGEQMQDRGREVGTTTGRMRRCGWLDLVAVKYSHMVNGYGSLNLTKLDVLDSFEEIWIGVAYTHKGITIASFPADLDVVEECEVVYEKMQGWLCDISACRIYEDLPIEARRFVEMVEKSVGVKVKWIGVGAGRDAMITRE